MFGQKTEEKDLTYGSGKVEQRYCQRTFNKYINSKNLDNNGVPEPANQQGFFDIQENREIGGISNFVNLSQKNGLNSNMGFDIQGQELGLAQGYFLRANNLEQPRSGFRLDQASLQIRKNLVESGADKDTPDTVNQKDYFKKNTEQILELIDYLAPAVHASDDFGSKEDKVGQTILPFTKMLKDSINSALKKAYQANNLRL